MRVWMAFAACVLLSGCGDAERLAACRPGADVICDITKPEDIEAVPNSRWLLVSELGAGDKPGHILLVDPATDERRVLAGGSVPARAEGESFSNCGAPPETLRPRGFHLSTAEDGGLRILIINGTRIERYRGKVDGDDVTLAWEGCVAIPKEVAANDIAALGDEGFVVSHMYDGPRSFVMDAKFILGVDTGAVYAWTRKGGWTRIPNSEVSFGNGIQVDPKTGRIYVASMYAQRIVAIDRDGGNRQVSARMPIQNDNLAWGPDGRLVGVGHTGFPVYGTARCREIGLAPCGFPFKVLAIDPKTLAFETLFESPKAEIPGASVAQIKDGVVYLGTAFGDRITKVRLK